jgi:hypothetical protein
MIHTGLIQINCTQKVAKATQLVAAIKQIIVSRPNLQKVSAVKLVFIGFPRSRAYPQRPILIDGARSFDCLYIPVQARIQLLSQIAKEQDRNAAGVKKDCHREQRRIEDVKRVRRFPSKGPLITCPRRA